MALLWDTLYFRLVPKILDFGGEIQIRPKGRRGSFPGACRFGTPSQIPFLHCQDPVKYALWMKRKHIFKENTLELMGLAVEKGISSFSLLKLTPTHR